MEGLIVVINDKNSFTKKQINENINIGIVLKEYETNYLVKTIYGSKVYEKEILCPTNIENELRTNLVNYYSAEILNLYVLTIDEKMNLLRNIYKFNEEMEEYFDDLLNNKNDIITVNISQDKENLIFNITCNYTIPALKKLGYNLNEYGNIEYFIKEIEYKIFKEVKDLQKSLSCLGLTDKKTSYFSVVEQDYSFIFNFGFNLKKINTDLETTDYSTLKYLIGSFKKRLMKKECVS